MKNLYRSLSAVLLLSAANAATAATPPPATGPLQAAQSIALSEHAMLAGTLSLPNHNMVLVSYLVTGLKWATGYAAVVECPQFFNTSFWSLWVEIQFYVLLPFLFLILRRCGVRGAAWSIFLFLLLFSFLSRTMSWPADPAAAG